VESVPEGSEFAHARGMKACVGTELEYSTAQYTQYNTVLVQYIAKSGT